MLNNIVLLVWGKIEVFCKRRKSSELCFGELDLVPKRVIHLSDTLWLKTGCEGTRQELITIWEELRKLSAFGSVKEECKLCYWIDTTDRVLRNRGEEKEFWMKLRFSGSSVHPDKTRVWDLDAEEWCQNNYFICIILKHLQYK